MQTILKKNIQQQILARSLYMSSILLINIALARFTNAAATGSLFYAMALFTLIVLLGGISLESALGYFYAGKKMSVQQLIKIAFFQIGIVIILIYSVQLFFPSWFTLLSSGFTQGLYIFVIGTLLSNYFLAVLYADKQYLSSNIIQTALNLLLLVVLWFQHKHFNDNNLLFQTYFYFILLNGILIFTLFVYKSRKTKMTIKNVQLSHIYRYAFQALWANVLFFLVYRLDYWFVHQYTSANASGNYIQAAKLAQLIILIPQFVAPVIFNSVAANSSSHQIHVVIIALMKLLLLLSILLLTILLISGQYIFTQLLGNSFNHLHYILLLLLPGLFFLSCLNLLSAYFAGINRIRINMIGAGLAAIVTCIGNICIIPFYSIYWAACISSLSYITASVWAIYHYRKLNPSISLVLFKLYPSDWKTICSLFYIKNV
ncbi:MAG: polysaccharide biosynthesis C-terminal domain-containing protein [Bacteroidota bacterium]|jgi:O-antigen/teichoic acid export membrane protein|nr:polysaccharide biosynthesis C-terminal domain-containing protein [Bacteroidota bacterium]